MDNKNIDFEYALSLESFTELLRYIVSIYGSSIYCDKKRLSNLLSDLMVKDERTKRLYRRAILDDDLAQKIYHITDLPYAEKELKIRSLIAYIKEVNSYEEKVAEEIVNSLVKGLDSRNPNTEQYYHKVGIGLGWDPNESTGFDNDITPYLFMLDSQGKVPNLNFIIYYDNKEFPDTAIQHSGDCITGGSCDGDDETFIIDLRLVDSKIDSIIYIVTIHDFRNRGQNFGTIRNSYIRLFDPDTNEDIYKIELDEKFSSDTLMEFGRFFRCREGWKFESIGIGYKEDIQYCKNKYVLSLTKKINSNNNHQLTLENFIKDHKDWFVDIICLYYPLSEYIIDKYEDDWNWECLSYNKNLPWSTELIERYKNKWNWRVLSHNTKLPWSIKLIDTYIDKWQWSGLGRNKGFPWSIYLINKYIEKRNWWSLSCNEGISWSIELIEKYKDRWYWSDLSYNKGLPWSIELIERYKEKWDWKGLSCNKGLPWSETLIEKYMDKWEWNWLTSKNNKRLPYSIELIKKSIDIWCLDCLNRGEGLPWSEELIKKHKIGGDWIYLIWNERLPWSEWLIKKYLDNWKWNELGLDYNRNGKRSVDGLSVEYIDKWFWNHLSCNKTLPWSEKRIGEYLNKWDWFSLSNNESLPWSIELIMTYRKWWRWSCLKYNRGLYDKIFQKYTEEEIDYLMGIATK